MIFAIHSKILCIPAENSETKAKKKKHKTRYLSMD